MAVVGQRINVGTNVTQLVGGDVHSGVLKNKGTASIFIGGSNVDTSDNAFELEIGEAVPFSLRGGDAIFGIVASGTQRVDVLRVSE